MAYFARPLTLEIEFDGKECVWCPLGAFFGSGYTDKPHRTFYVQRNAQGLFTSLWVMPFQKEATIRIRNLGKEKVTVNDFSVATSDWQWDSRSLYFHGSWFELRHTDTTVRRDVTFNTVTGRGVYVGDVLTIFNTIPNWWGEGDEKIFVDGETFPSHFGTGTEDYYGYAWCRPDTFSQPFHSQPNARQADEEFGVTTNTRYRALDAIPFNKSLQMDMELWHPYHAKVNYAPATFWYGDGDAESSTTLRDPKAVTLPVARSKEDVLNHR